MQINLCLWWHSQKISQKSHNYLENFTNKCIENSKNFCIYFLQKLEDPWLIKSSGSELSVGRTFQANGIWQIGKKSSKISLSHKCENRCFDLITFELTKRFPFAQIRINHIKNSQKNTRNSKKTQGILQKPQGFEKNEVGRQCQSCSGYLKKIKQKTTLLYIDIRAC